MTTSNFEELSPVVAGGTTSNSTTPTYGTIQPSSGGDHYHHQEEGEDGDGDDDIDGDDHDEEGARMFRRLTSSFQDKEEGDDGDGGVAGLLLSVRYTLRDTLTHSILRFSGTACSVRDQGGTATISNEILNLVKNIVGAGALALPSGVAAFANTPSALYTASIWLLIMGCIFAYYFLLIGRTCKLTRTATYAEAWERSMGRNNGSGLVALAVALKAGMGNLECSMILADSFKDLFTTIGWITVTRNGALLLVTIVTLLPLCLLKNLAVLAPFSMLGMLAMIFTAIAMFIRYIDGSYSYPDGQYIDDIKDDMKPSFGSIGGGMTGGLSLNVLILLCMISEAYIAHYNAPRFWMELKQRSVPRFTTVVSSSFSISAFYYIFVTTFGFLTFGGNSSGFILNNYSTNDTLISISRACVGFSLIFGYPLIFVGFRDAMLDVLMIPQNLQTSNNLNVLTLLLLIIITLLAMVLTDLGIVTAVGGGTLGTVVVFIVPTLMFCRTIHRLGVKATPRQKQETYFVTILMWVGIAIGVIGVWIAVTR